MYAHTQLRVFIAAASSAELVALSSACDAALPRATLTQSADPAALLAALAGAAEPAFNLVVMSAGLAEEAAALGLKDQAASRSIGQVRAVVGGDGASCAVGGAASRLGAIALSGQGQLGCWLAGVSSALAAGVAIGRDEAEGGFERRYEELVQALPDIVYELDPGGVIRFVNQSVALLGYEPNELIGRHFSVLLHEEDAEAVDRDKVLAEYRGHRTGPALAPKLFNERRGIDRRTAELEVRLKKKGLGSGPINDLIAEVISYGEVSAAGEYGLYDDGGFKGSVGIIRDVSLRRKSEEMLRKLYQAVDQLSSCVFVVNHAFETEYVNPAFFLITGFSPAEVIGVPIFRFFALTPEKADAMRKRVQDGFDLREEILVPKARQGQFWADVALSPVRSPGGVVTHAIAIVEDISARKGMEELLRGARRDAESANHAKTRFLASITHELKSPIASIITAARLVQHAPEEAAKRAEAIVDYAQSLEDILGGILDYVRSEGGDPVMRRLDFPLGPFIEGLCFGPRNRAEAKGLRFELSSQAGQELNSDPDRLGRAISILLDNAVKYTTEGSIHVSAGIERASGNVPHLRVTVRDTGVGIRSEDREQIFSPFTRVGPLRGVESRGAGVGLALARNIVRVLGGEIRVDSSPGAGSAFSLIVPAGAPKATPFEGAAGSYVILLVDDNEVNLEFMRTLVENGGYKVRTAASASEAFRVLEERYVDAAILDIRMPGYSGVELAKAIRAYAGRRYDPSMPLFAMTAHGSEELADSLSVFREVFSKPLDMRRVLAAVKDALAEREALSLGDFNAQFARRRHERLGALDEIKQAGVRALKLLRQALADQSDRVDVRAEADRLSGALRRFGGGAGPELVRLFTEYYGQEDRDLLEGLLNRAEAMILAATAAAEAEGSL